MGCVLQNCKDFGETASIQKEGEGWMKKYILLSYVSFVFFFLLNNLFFYLFARITCVFLSVEPLEPLEVEPRQL